MALPEASLANELLLEAAVQQAFTDAAVRHLPAEALRADLVAAESEAEHGIWLMFPRATGSRFRYKKFTLLQPVQITRPLARAVIYADGQTLEDRLLDAGVRSWPVAGQAHFYELLPGAQLGHLAAFELAGEGVGTAGQPSYAEAATEFAELSPARPLPFAHPVDRGRPGWPAGTSAQHAGPPGRPLAPGTRMFRIDVPGIRLRRRAPFTLRLDLAGPRPVLRVHLRLGERVAHELIGHLQRHQHVQVVALIRQQVGAPVRLALADRVHRLLLRRGISAPHGSAARIADALADGIARCVASQLPAAAAALTAAAKDPKAGLTLTFAFTPVHRAGLLAARLGEPTLSIRAGTDHHD